MKFGPQGRTEQDRTVAIWSTRKGRTSEFGPQVRTEQVKFIPRRGTEQVNLTHKGVGNIRIWSTRKDRNSELAHKEEQRTFETDSQNIEFDPRREVKNLVTGQDIDIKISKDVDQIKLLS